MDTANSAQQTKRKILDDLLRDLRSSHSGVPKEKVQGIINHLVGHGMKLIGEAALSDSDAIAFAGAAHMLMAAHLAAWEEEAVAAPATAKQELEAVTK